MSSLTGPFIKTKFKFPKPLSAAQVQERLIPDTSNWLIPGKVLVGAYPDPNKQIPKFLLDIGVTTIINLQTVSEMKTFRSYEKDIPKVTFINFPIEDRGISEDNETLTFYKRPS